MLWTFTGNGRVAVAFKFVACVHVAGAVVPSLLLLL